MATTDWNTESFPGGSVGYNESTLEYSQTTVFEDAGTPRYNTVGVATSWSLEDK